MKPHLVASWTVLFLGLAAAASTAAGTFKHIVVDGRFDDWIGVPVAHEDPADSAKSADYRKIWIANDDEYLYLRFTLERPVNPFTSHENLFIDADADGSTGFNIIVGSELLIQGGAGYQERGGGFNEGGITDLQWQAAPEGAATQFEARLSRKALFTSDKSPVFGSATIALLLEAEDGNFARQETAPDAEGLVYEFAPAPPAFTGSVQLLPLGASWRYRAADASVDLAWVAADYDDSGAGWASGPALFGYAPNPEAYPAAIATPLSTTVSTWRLRTRFSWNANPGGVVFVATNVLSDGAAFYLNGAEVRRVRLPAGNLTPATPATGGPPTAGQPEVFALASGPLVQGENLLAVEVHQTPGTPADLVFGLSLLASASFPATIPDSAQPTNRAVVAGQATGFSVEVIGTEPLSYAWLKDGQPIAGATNAAFVLEAVLPGDAGTYSVRVSNPAHPAGVTSRGAVLTVLSTPLSIAQAPVAATVTEGEPARFSVTVTGSAPIAYQWYRNGVAIPNATAATLEFPDVRDGDAGEYLVEVSNPATPALRTVGVLLRVLRDAVPPALVSVAGSPNEIVLGFSEPIDPASAQTLANYSVGGGVTVAQARVEAAAPDIVRLQTAGQTLGSVYEVAVGGVKDRFGNASGAVRRRFLSTVRIDGSFDDWAGLAPATEDPADAENATDYGNVWITSDSDHVYLRVQLHQPSDLGIFYNNLFVNADGDAATGFGFRGVGSEILIQGGSGYQQKGGAFNEGGIEGLEWIMAPQGVGTDFEIQFSRHAKYANDGLPVFTAETISLFLESENTSFQTVDVAPDAEPIVHQLLNTALPELGSLGMVRVDGRLRVSWTGAGRLQSATSLAPANWQDVAGAGTPYEVTPTAQAVFYRLSQ